MFLTSCFCFLGGNVLYFSLTNFPSVSYVLFIFPIVLFAIVQIKTEKRYCLICIVCVSVGYLQVYFVEQKYYHDVDIPQQIVGVVVREPDVRIDGVRYTLQSSEIPYHIYLKQNLYPRYQYGDVLRLSCDLKKPEAFDGFRYDMYLRSRGIGSVCLARSVQKIANRGNIVFSEIIHLKDWFAQRINRLWHEPYAGLMAGLLYGYRGGLGSLNEAFNRTGVTHIVAISGYNISLIATILMSLLSRLLIPRQIGFRYTVMGITLFVFFAGASASVVRAGIMGSLVLCAKHIGRMSRPSNILTCTAVVMTAINPYVLVWDAGFQLSFLAVIGLIYIAPMLEKVMMWIPEWFSLRESVVCTVSATFITLPLILYQFERLSIVALVVNILILWVIPWIMLIGFGVVLLGFGAIVPQLMMSYVVSVVMIFSGLDYASLEYSIGLVEVLLLYGLLYVCYKIKKHRERRC